MGQLVAMEEKTQRRIVWSLATMKMLSGLELWNEGNRSVFVEGRGRG